MTSSTSSTAAVTSSSISTRVGTALDQAKIARTAARLRHLRELKDRIDVLQQRGLLRRQQFVVSSASDFQRRYMRPDKALVQ